jgi:N-acetylglucosamine-6-sulfatase
MDKTNRLFDVHMTRRDAIKLMGTTAAGFMGLPHPAYGSAVPGTSSEKPNIVFILSDNIQHDDFGYMNHPFIKTPGLDKLAAEGVVFENAFNTTSLCSPSRASILTGFYPHNHGVKNNHTPWTGQKTTFLEYLKKAGYDTAFIGKWHMPGEGLPNIPYLDLFVSYTYREGQGSYFNCPLVVNGTETQPRKEYLTEELTDRAIEFIEATVEADGARRPFCLYLSHRAAHPPFVPPEDIRGMYADEKVELPKEVDSWFSKTNGNVFQGVMMGSYENQYRRYCEVITAMDRQIRRFVDKIDALGLNDNTIVMFAADNGMRWGEHRCHGIRQPYEEALRVPFIVRCPWLVKEPGRRRHQMVLNIDIAPALLDIAGVPIPADMNGESFIPFLIDGDAPGRKAWLIEFWKYYPENTPSYVGVRTEAHKYIEYEKTLRPQLFDLAADPREQHNLVGTPEGDKLIPELKSMLETLIQDGKP